MRGWLDCAGSYWLSCRGFCTALYARPLSEQRIWLSPVAGIELDLSSSVLDVLRSSPPQWDGCHCKAGENGHVQTDIPYAFLKRESLQNNYFSSVCFVLSTDYCIQLYSLNQISPLVIARSCCVLVSSSPVPLSILEVDFLENLKKRLKERIMQF